jgi:CMP-N-acetylneuraminic acid synthetase
MKIIIPARKGSKGFPFKNRKLFKYTADIVPNGLKDNTYVITDDEEIQKMSIDSGFSHIERPHCLSTDTVSTKRVMEHAIDVLELNNELVLMLYLTYPERTWDDVEGALDTFLSTKANSLLCRKEIKASPFLMLKEEEDEKGSQLICHDLYRRQDYPKCFELSHYVCIFKSNEVELLNNNLYNENTVYFKIDNHIIDVDYEKNLLDFNNER